MDQIKIGKFIAERRKTQNLTQMQLAEKLGITNRAVSKWENGKTMPDSALMLELCDILDITVNDLLNGEMVSSEDYSKKLEAQLMEAIQSKELSDKRLLTTRPFIYIIAITLTIFTNLIVRDTPAPGWVRFCASIVNLLLLSVLLFADIKILQSTGYYRCSECGYTYTPSFWRMFWGAGANKYAKLRCPQCKKHNKHEKVFTKDKT